MKKNLILIYCLFFTITAFAQLPDGTFKLQGHIAKLNKGTIFLGYQLNNGNMVADSSTIVNGDFEFTGKISQPVAAYLQLTSTKQLDRATQVIFLDPNIIDVELTNEPFATLSVKGSKTEDEYMEWKNANNALKQKFAHVLQNATAENDVAERKLHEDSLSLYNDLKHQVEYDFIKNYPRSYVTPALLQTHYRYYATAQLYEIYNNMSPALQMSKNGKYLLENIAKMQGNKKGDQAN